jgi:hypothetical protein
MVFDFKQGILLFRFTFSIDILKVFFNDFTFAEIQKGGVWGSPPRAPPLWLPLASETAGLGGLGALQKAPPPFSWPLLLSRYLNNKKANVNTNPVGI